MSWTVTIKSGMKDVVLPNGLRYQAGADVVLSDTEYSKLSASAITGVLTGAGTQSAG